MHRLSPLSVLLLLLALCCQTPRPDPAPLVSELKKLAGEALPTDTAKFERIDSLLEQINACESPEASLEAAVVCHEVLGRGLLSMKKAFLSRKYYFRALEIRQNRYGVDSNHIDILRLYHNLGETYRSEGNLQKAVEYYDKADVRTPEAMRKVHFYNMLRRGIVLRYMGEHEKALDDFERGYQYTKDSSFGKPAVNFILGLFSEYAGCYRDMGRYGEALDKAREGNQLAAQVRADTNFHEGIAILFMTNGNIWQDSLFFAKTEPEKKLTFDSAEYYTKAAYLLSRDAVLKIQCAGNLGSIYYRNQHLDPAERVLKEGIDLARRMPSVPEEAAPLYVNLGAVRHDRRDYAGALQSYGQALRVLGAAASTEKLPVLTTLKGSKSDLLILLKDIAMSWVDSAGQAPDRAAVLEKASTVYDSMLAFINYLRGDLMSDGAKIDLVEGSRDWLSQAFDGNIRLYRETGEIRHLERAFQITEQSKAFALLEAIRLRKLAAQFPRSVQDKENELLNLERTANTPEERAKVDRQKREFVKYLHQTYPAYSNLKYQAALKSPDEIAAALAKDQALISYYFQDSTTYAFVVNAGRLFVDSFRIARAELSQRVRQFQLLLSNPSPDSAAYRMIARQEFELYQQVFEGLEKFSLPERLVIVADTPLLNIPFDALLVRALKGPDLNPDPDSYLLARHSFSYCFSANMLAQMAEYPVPCGLSTKLAVFAPVEETNPKTEVDNIAARVAAEVFLPRQSTKANFEEACRHHARIHVATHGKMKPNPDSSYIQFYDTLLYLRELYGWRLKQDLIVFSACETASGPFRAGEGNMSLARGLAYAGVRSCITAQWEVPTEGKAWLMPEFYGFLNENMPRDRALKQAKRKFLKDNGNNHYPGNWAGLILIGTSVPPKPGSCENGWYYAVAGLAVLALLGVAWRGYRRRVQSSRR